MTHIVNLTQRLKPLLERHVSMAHWSTWQRSLATTFSVSIAGLFLIGSTYPVMVNSFPYTGSDPAFEQDSGAKLAIASSQSALNGRYSLAGIQASKQSDRDLPFEFNSYQTTQLSMRPHRSQWHGTQVASNDINSLAVLARDPELIKFGDHPEATRGQNIAHPNANLGTTALYRPNPHKPADNLANNAANNVTDNDAETSLWLAVQVKNGDTLTQLFNRHDISVREAYNIVEHKSARALLRFKPGETIKLRKDEDGVLQELHYAISKYDSLQAVRDAKSGKYSVEIIKREPTVNITTAQGKIYGNLFSSAAAANVSEDVVRKFATIFGWQVDFSKDLQAGDEFKIVYEQRYLDGDMMENGDIIAAELITDSQKFAAVRFVDEDGHASYYAPDGSGIKGSFLRNPIPFARVSSRFSKNRMHPIKKTWRAHKGVDYAAPSGTPIKATGKGTISFAGNRKGYGRTIVIKHGKKYTTLYAHMKGFAKGIKRGSRIKQGQVIGYVGRTGWATGPHLHYEFRVNNVHKNPLTVKLPPSESLENRHRKKFKQQSQQWLAMFDKPATEIKLARRND